MKRKDRAKGMEIKSKKEETKDREKRKEGAREKKGEKVKRKNRPREKRSMSKRRNKNQQENRKRRFEWIFLEELPFIRRTQDSNCIL